MTYNIVLNVFCIVYASKQLKEWLSKNLIHQVAEFLNALKVII